MSAGPLAIPATSDHLFQSETLGLRWQWNANHEAHWHSLTARPRHLRLFSQLAPGSDLSGVLILLLQKFAAKYFTVEADIKFFPDGVTEKAGLVVLGWQTASPGLQKSADGFHLARRAEGAESAFPVGLSSIRLADFSSLRFHSIDEPA